MPMFGNKIKHKNNTSAYERVILTGNPNVGKSVIFGLLTGQYVTVSNYPGTTVEVARGNLVLGDKKFLLVDSPGVNSLVPMSEDEKVTRDLLLKEHASLVIHVADSKNLKRSLFITMQVIEMGLPLILVLNMDDEARDKGIILDTKKLGELTGLVIITTVAPQRKGLKELREAILKPSVSGLSIKYSPLIEEYLEKIISILPETNISRRSIAVMVLSGDESLREWLIVNLPPDKIKEIESLRDACQSKTPRSLNDLINNRRRDLTADIADQVIRHIPASGGKIASFIGRISMHPVWGIPILLLVLFGLYEFVGVFGAGTLVNFFEKIIFGRYLNPMTALAVKLLIPIEVLQELLVGEYGLFTVAITYAIAIILPITATFFIAFALLEDSGYLPRLAIMSNKAFNLIGLNGKAVLPMVLGLGCGTMAVMTSRILETRRDRIIITFLLALAIPCSAQIGVIMGMLSALSYKATLVWSASILLTILVAGFLASKVIPGEKTAFFLEIPPIRKPDAMNILIKTVGRVEWYLKEAVPLFLLGTFILFLLHKLNLLGALEKAASPVIVNVLGLPEKTTESFILGFLRRDYGAAGLFTMAQKGLLTPVQSVVSLVTITLFIPCLASFFMIIKEMGLKIALGMILLVFSLAFIAGGSLNWLLTYFRVTL